MDISTIEVEERTATGRNQVQRIREQGKVPAVLYGAGQPSRILSVIERELERHVRQHHKVFKLNMGGKEQAIFLQNVQWDVLTDRAMHVDFLRIDLDKPMQVQVELAYLGHPMGISKGGRLVKDLLEVKITCLPAAIPDNIELQVSHLDLEETVVASALELPEGVTLDLPADTQICHMTGEEVEEEVVEEGTEGAPEGGEGAEGTPTGDDAPSGGGDAPSGG